MPTESWCRLRTARPPGGSWDGPSVVGWSSQPKGGDHESRKAPSFRSRGWRRCLCRSRGLNTGAWVGHFTVGENVPRTKRQHMQQHDTHLTFPSFFLHSSFFMSFSSAAPRARQLHKHHSSLCSSQLLFCSSSSFVIIFCPPTSKAVVIVCDARSHFSSSFGRRFFRALPLANRRQ